MDLNQDNKVILLCIEGMEMEGTGQMAEASHLFNEAWRMAKTDFEKFTAAHYVARHQENISDKLKWDKTAIDFALKVKDENIRDTYPSLYLNIAKCYEDSGDFDNASVHYKLAHSFSDFLPDDGYGRMIKQGIINGMERMENQTDPQT